jgi:membrane-associated protease RseP (regulator of RpoE activity)
LIYAIAVVWGLPNLKPPAAVVGQTACVASDLTKGKSDECTGQGPAALAGIKPGDTVVKVGDKPVATFEDMAAAIRPLNGPTQVVVQRAGKEVTTTVDVTRAKRWLKNSDTAPTDVGAIGVRAAEPPGFTRYNPLTAIPGTFAFTGDLSVELAKSLVKIPTKVGALVHSIGGGERDPNTPISVVGATIIGGDAVDHGLWVAFWFFLAQLNFVLGAINLIPLLPFDGGHVAVAVFEKIRNMIRSARGILPAAPVNYLKLMPVTYVILVVVAGYMLLTVTADFVNPIRPFQ